MRKLSPKELPVIEPFLPMWKQLLSRWTITRFYEIIVQKYKQLSCLHTNFDVLQETSNKKNATYVKWNRDLEIKYRALLRTQFWHLER
jgi:hypothetical protein